jgi:glutathione S-transferase
MKLYYAPGTISLMPHVALLESGLSFVAVRVDEASKKMADGGDFRSINPLGYLPALQLDDGSVLLEAAAIAQYIADRDPVRKLAPPNGTIERARFQGWLNFLSSELHKGGLGPLFYPALDDRAKDVFRERLRSRFAFVDQHLSTHESTGQGLLDCRCRPLCDHGLGASCRLQYQRLSEPDRALRPDRQA